MKIAIVSLICLAVAAGCTTRPAGVRPGTLVVNSVPLVQSVVGPYRCETPVTETVCRNPRAECEFDCTTDCESGGFTIGGETIPRGDCGALCITVCEGHPEELCREEPTGETVLTDAECTRCEDNLVDRARICRVRSVEDDREYVFAMDCNFNPPEGMSCSECRVPTLHEPALGEQTCRCEGEPAITFNCQHGIELNLSEVP